MKKLGLFIAAIALSLSATAQNSLYELSFTDIEGNEISMEQFKGKKILFVNTASECGFTPQYEELQALHEKFGDKIAIIGFPCDQFGGQEPGSEEEIQSFCKKNYGVTFLMASKIEVKGEGQHEIYQWLTQQAGDVKVKWNFEKFIVDEEGNLVEHYRSMTKPMDQKITDLL
ncbi:MAG: glutathione peroxidase [Fluviicola sp. XM-24bin1]|jgi:glutathione peroxidase|nr:MAG: glutathione peroxidase [Fluviicola sp. XM-24bin1]